MKAVTNTPKHTQQGHLLTPWDRKAASIPRVGWECLCGEPPLQPGGGGHSDQGTVIQCQDTLKPSLAPPAAAQLKSAPGPTQPGPWPYATQSVSCQFASGTKSQADALQTPAHEHENYSHRHFVSKKIVGLLYRPALPDLKQSPALLVSSTQGGNLCVCCVNNCLPTSWAPGPNYPANGAAFLRNHLLLVPTFPAQALNEAHVLVQASR